MRLTIGSVNSQLISILRDGSLPSLLFSTDGFQQPHNAIHLLQKAIKRYIIYIEKDKAVSSGLKKNRTESQRTNAVNGYRELPLNGDMQKRREYWEAAKGLQATDGLTTSEYLESVIEDTLTGRYDTAEAVKRVGRYYENGDRDSREKEADLSAARITHILERGGFTFSPVTLQAIHRELFTDVFKPEWVGVYRTVNLEKSEDVLNGRSVQYADYSAITDTLTYDFGEQRKVRYQLPFDKAQVASIAGFISNVWQVHPFREGNTRTVATFLMLYLQSLGIDIDNEPFREHAGYFRDALVRSNYASIRDGIVPDNSFLMMFFENILLHAGHDLEAQDLRCKELFDGQK